MCSYFSFARSSIKIYQRILGNLHVSSKNDPVATIWNLSTGLNCVKSHTLEGSQQFSGSCAKSQVLPGIWSRARQMLLDTSSSLQDSAQRLHWSLWMSCFPRIFFRLWYSRERTGSPALDSCNLSSMMSWVQISEIFKMKVENTAKIPTYGIVAF